MRAAIYNPYLDTLGGGERYTAAFAVVLQSLGYEVDFEWPDIGIKEKIENRFGFDLSKINFIDDIKKGEAYDLVFWLSDGSIPLLRGRRNFIHFQFPFTAINGKSLINKMKLWRVEKIICNSKFTKSYIDKEFGLNSLVLYPPVDTESIIQKQKKEDIILYVGRFSQLTQSKNQDKLIDIFKTFCSKTSGKWKLVLAGGAEIGATEYLAELKKMSKSVSVEIIKSPNYKVLKRLYSNARYFWSAAGFGIDDKKEPTRVEHFGITAVEAMAGGAIPFLYNAGGFKEIVSDGIDGFLWDNEDRLINSTVDLINSSKLEKNIREKAIESSKKFSFSRFKESILELVK